MPSRQHEPAEVAPVEAIPLDEHCEGDVADSPGALGAAEDGAGGGLSPPPPNSVDPIGMPGPPAPACAVDAVWGVAASAGLARRPSIACSPSPTPGACLPPPFG